MRPWVVRLVLDLYPAPVRDRYGAEIAELLAGSTRPWRDLADVGRAALGERIAAWTKAQTKARTAPERLRAAGIQLRRLAWITTVPWSLNLAALLVTIVPGTVLAMLETFQVMHPTPTTDNLARAAAVVPVCAEAAWFANRRARTAPPVAALVTVPAALAVGTVVILRLLGADPTGLAATAGAWCAATVALGIASQVLVSRGRRRLALVVLVVGGLVVLDLSCTYWGLASHRAGPGWLSAQTVWPLAFSIVDRSGGGIGNPVTLPVTLTLCTAYALPLVGRRAGREAGENAR